MQGEISTIQSQVVSFENELNHLKSLEDKYKLENSDLQMRIDGESGKNYELNQAITDLQVKINQKEQHIGYLKNELQVAQNSNSSYVDTSSSLKVEIDSLNQHIAIITT
jgi:chromosome segregation ATPase